MEPRRAIRPRRASTSSPATICTPGLRSTSPRVGWYPFEPTPGFSAPAAMEANAPRPQIPIPGYNPSPQNPAPRQQEGPEPAPETQKTPADDGSASSAEKTPTPTPY